MTFILILLLVLLLLVLTVSYFLLRTTSHPKFFTTAQTIEIEGGKGYLTGYEDLPKESYLIQSYDGYELHATKILNPGSNKVVIITHGHTYTQWGSIKYLMMFYRLGYNAVIYDDRGHGENKPFPVSMGYRESKDLMAVIEDTYQQFGLDCYLGLHGESMGSAICLQALKFHPKIHFIVSDCGYSDLIFFTRMFIRSGFHLPSFFVPIADCMAKPLYGYHLHEVSPIKQLMSNQVPICFIHGGNDHFIDPCNAKRMYEADSGYKELHIFDGAGHAESYATDPTRYFSILKSFLTKVERSDYYDRENTSKNKDLACGS